jgi:cation diffusion facilitator family transporter
VSPSGTTISLGVEEIRARIRAGRIALAVGGAIFAGKLAAYLLTGSAALLSDALESIVNVVAAALLLYSLTVAARPADRSHPYGHGKVEFFSAGVEGTLIAVASTLILIEAGRALWFGPNLRRVDLGLLLFAGLTAMNAALGAYLLRIGRRTQSLALQADGQHVLTDVATSLGIMVGLLAVQLTGWTPLDPLIAIAVALNILRTGWSLLRAAVGGLMDEADDELLRTMAQALEEKRRPWMVDVHSLRAWRSGAFQHVDLHVTVPRYYDAEQLHHIDDEITDQLLAAAGRAGDVIVHFDPCRPRECPGCGVADCPVRAAPFLRREALTLERATREDLVVENEGRALGASAPARGPG